MSLLNFKRDKTMEYLAAHDRLTDLPSRRKMLDFFEQLPYNAKGFVYVIFCVNGFSTLHTMFGYTAGGYLLKNIAGLLSENIEDGEFASRIKDEYFGVFLHFSTQELLLQRLHILFQKLEEVRVTDGFDFYEYHCTYSCSAMALDGEEKEFESINQCVFFALPEFSGQKETKIQFVNQEIKDCFVLQYSLKDEIYRAFRNKELVPYFQLQYDLMSKEIIGAEVLARWKHPDKGILEPKVFIPVLEEAGMIAELDILMLEEACMKLQEWMRKGLVPVPLSINISHLNMYKAGFVQRMTEIVQKYDITPSLICLEMSEAAICNDLEDVLPLIERLKGYGFMLAIDDFGFGSSTYNMLRTITIDTVKLVKNFIPKSKMEEKDKIVINNAVNMLKQLHIKVISEGIETTDQVIFLKSIACNFVQGFLFSRPVPDDEFERLLFKN